MSSHAVCFAAPSPFLSRTTALHSTCLRAPARRVPTRRLRATAEPANDPANSGLSSNVAPFSDDAVPGKVRLGELEIAAQRTALDKYTMQLRKKQMAEDREAARIFGFVPFAETLNGRLAMFFIVTGVLTEYWTGYTLPQQVELMLRTLGVF